MNDPFRIRYCPECGTRISPAERTSHKGVARSIIYCSERCKGRKNGREFYARHSAELLPKQRVYFKGYYRRPGVAERLIAAGSARRQRS
jgi:hypothetical protein